MAAIDQPVDLDIPESSVMSRTISKVKTGGADIVIANYLLNLVCGYVSNVCSLFYRKVGD